MRKIFGAVLIALPLLSWIAFAMATAGLAPTAFILLFIAVVFGCIFTGAVLLDG
jgi:hypothetical protein